MSSHREHSEEELQEMRSSILGMILQYVISENCGESHNEFLAATFKLAAKEYPDMARQQVVASLFRALGQTLEQVPEPDVLVKFAERTLQKIIFACQSKALQSLIPSEGLLARTEFEMVGLVYEAP